LAKLPSWKELFKSLVCIPKFSSDRERIRDAFSVLRGIGFSAKMSFDCCNTCAWSRIECGKSGAVFWTIPADSAFDMDRNIQSTLFLQWFGDARVICSVLRSRGLIVREPPTKTSAIAVLPGTSYDNMIEYASYTKERDYGGYVSDGDGMDVDEEDED
jgi:predicted deacylase